MVIIQLQGVHSRRCCVRVQSAEVARGRCHIHPSSSASTSKAWRGVRKARSTCLPSVVEVGARRCLSAARVDLMDTCLQVKKKKWSCFTNIMVMIDLPVCITSNANTKNISFLNSTRCDNNLLSPIWGYSTDIPFDADFQGLSDNLTHLTGKLIFLELFS